MEKYTPDKFAPDVAVDDMAGAKALVSRVVRRVHGIVGLNPALPNLPLEYHEEMRMIWVCCFV